MTTLINSAFVKRIAKARPPKVRDFRDNQLRGFLVRQQPTGTVTYYAQARRGRRERIGTHPAITATDAREAARTRPYD